MIQRPVEMRDVFYLSQVNVTLKADKIKQKSSKVNSKDCCIKKVEYAF